MDIKVINCEWDLTQILRYLALLGLSCFDFKRLVKLLGSLVNGKTFNFDNDFGRDKCNISISCSLVSNSLFLFKLNGEWIDIKFIDRDGIVCALLA